MPLAWTPHLIDGGTLYTAQEVRDGCALSHRFEHGGILATLTTTATWAEADEYGRISSVLSVSVALRGRDPLTVADDLAQGWAV